MAYDDTNIFAKILRGEIRCERVYEDEKVLAFHDIHPRAPIHVLVIPKEPYVSFIDFSTHAPPADVAIFFQTVSKIASDLGITETGFRLVTNIGHEGGQEVPHFHVHIIGGTQLGGIA